MTVEAEVLKDQSVCSRNMETKSKLNIHLLSAQRVTVTVILKPTSD